MGLQKKLAAELLGTLFLLTIVVGSGIMGDRLSQGNTAIALLANSIATGCGLVFLIWVFGPISGAHLNPVVTLVSYLRGHQTKIEALLYFTVQITGAVLGVMLAHIMFAEPLVALSSHDRSGSNQLVSEFVASFGLIMVIFGMSKSFGEKIPMAVGIYITAAYWFTSSTSFANPAVTLARSLTDSFTGIDPKYILGFVFAQILGAVAAHLTFRWFYKDSQ